ncbi:MAG: hypothetical protein QNL97_13365 [Pseudomonadales bacterium]
MKHFIIAAVLALVPMTLTAQDFHKGFAAHQAGDYATAIQEWTPLAEAGDVNAQFSLGFMYKYGQGVPQDYAALGHLFKN